MIRGKLWLAKQDKVKEVHVWRPRRSRYGELVQWDTSEHDWLEGRGEQLYLIAMIDDATSRLWARFVRHDSTEENMRLLWSYLEKFGRPLAYYTDKASLFRTAEKRKRDEPGVEKDAVEMPPTQIGRALRELGIAWIAAHSAPAKGRVERNFGTAQDRLVKGLRVAGVKTIGPANQYLEDDYLVWWERELTVEAANPDDAHRRLDKSHNLAGLIEPCGNAAGAQRLHPALRRRVVSDPTTGDCQWITQGQRTGREAAGRLAGGAARPAISAGELVRRARETGEAPAVKAEGAARKKPQRGSDWNRNFDLKKAPKVWQAAQESGYQRRTAE